MIVNLDKFKSIILIKSNSDNISIGFSLGTDTCTFFYKKPQWMA